MNLNRVILIGRLTADPELRTTGSGTPVTNFSLATNRYWSNSNGERQEETEFHNIVVWARQAEIVNQFLKKGSLVMIEGRLQTRNWEDKNGSKRYTTEVVAKNVQFGPRGGGNDSFPEGGFDQTKNNNQSSDNNKKNKEKVKDEDLPEINLDKEGEEINPDDIPF